MKKSLGVAGTETAKDEARGLYHKYYVERLNDPTGKHDGCEYFILDLNHDKHAYAALLAYILSCRKEFPSLADDLSDKCTTMEKWIYRDAKPKSTRKKKIGRTHWRSRP